MVKKTKIKKVKKSKKISNKKSNGKLDTKKYPTLKLKRERDIAMDFATRAFKKFDKIIKSVVFVWFNGKKYECNRFRYRHNFNHR